MHHIQYGTQTIISGPTCCCSSVSSLRTGGRSIGSYTYRRCASFDVLESLTKQVRSYCGSCRYARSGEGFFAAMCPPLRYMIPGQDQPEVERELWKGLMLVLYVSLYHRLGDRKSRRLRWRSYSLGLSQSWRGMRLIGSNGNNGGCFLGSS